MKIKSKLFIIAISPLLFFSCKKYPKLGNSVNKGEIIGSIETSKCDYTMPDEVVIKTQAELDTVFKNSCTNIPDTFDFVNYSIIGRIINGGGCGLKIIREVIINHVTRNYTYKICFKDKGICFSKLSDYNLVLVPKIPDQYDVVFKVEED